MIFNIIHGYLSASIEDTMKGRSENKKKDKLCVNQTNVQNTYTQDNFF